MLSRGTFRSAREQCFQQAIKHQEKAGKIYGLGLTGKLGSKRGSPTWEEALSLEMRFADEVGEAIFP